MKATKTTATATALRRVSPYHTEIGTVSLESGCMYPSLDFTPLHQNWLFSVSDSFIEIIVTDYSLYWTILY